MFYDKYTNKTWHSLWGWLALVDSLQKFDFESRLRYSGNTKIITVEPVKAKKTLLI